MHGRRRRLISAEASSLKQRAIVFFFRAKSSASLLPGAVLWRRKRASSGLGRAIEFRANAPIRGRHIAINWSVKFDRRHAHAAAAKTLRAPQQQQLSPSLGQPDRQ